MQGHREDYIRSPEHRATSEPVSPKPRIVSSPNVFGPRAEAAVPELGAQNKKFRPAPPITSSIAHVRLISSGPPQRGQRSHSKAWPRISYPLHIWNTPHAPGRRRESRKASGARGSGGGVHLGEGTKDPRPSGSLLRPSNEEPRAPRGLSGRRDTFLPKIGVIPSRTGAVLLYSGRMASGPEARARSRIVHALRELGCVPFVIHGGVFSAGIPDLLAVRPPDGTFLAIEMKAHKVADLRRVKTLTQIIPTPTALQIDALNSIAKAGGRAFVVVAERDEHRKARYQIWLFRGEKPPTLWKTLPKPSDVAEALILHRASSAPSA